MKKVLILITLSLVTTLLFAQKVKNKKTKSYGQKWIFVKQEFNTSKKMYQFTFRQPQGDGLSDTSIYVKNGYSFKVTDFTFLPRVGLLTVPFKNRIGINGQSAKAIGKFDNAGVSLSFFNWRKRYFAFNGSKSEHFFSIPLLFAVSPLKLDGSNTEGKVVNEVSEPIGTLGLGLSYNYRGLEIGIYSGYDIGLTKRVQTKWDYRGFNNWIGVGIGIKPGFIQMGL